ATSAQSAQNRTIEIGRQALRLLLSSWQSKRLPYNSEFVAELTSDRQPKCIVWKVEKESASSFTCLSLQALRYSRSCLFIRARRRLWRRSRRPGGGSRLS